jgi:hypothetical protein
MNKAIQYVFIAACLVGAAYLFGRALVARDNNRIDRATTFSYKVAYEKSKRDAPKPKRSFTAFKRIRVITSRLSAKI